MFDVISLLGMWTIKAMLDILNEVEACGHIYTIQINLLQKGLLFYVRLDWNILHCDDIKF